MKSNSETLTKFNENLTENTIITMNIQDKLQNIETILSDLKQSSEEKGEYLIHILYCIVLLLCMDFVSS